LDTPSYIAQSPLQVAAVPMMEVPYWLRAGSCYRNLGVAAFRIQNNCTHSHSHFLGYLATQSLTFLVT